MTIVFYVSGHGLGHASRAAELIAVLLRHRDVRVIVRSSAPRWMFRELVSPRFDISAFEPDSGMSQVDSLHIDESGTASAAAAFYRDFDRLVEAEAAHLRTLDAALVLGDVPPLAFPAARRAGLPSAAVANFTWDWIYGYYRMFEDQAPGVIATIQRAYADATCALRLPIHGGFTSMPRIEDVPFIARRSTRNRADTRRLLGLDSQQPVVLSSFGGRGVELPLARVAASGLTVITPDHTNGSSLKHEDLVAAADVVASKPGYGIVSECVANGTPLLFASRGRFTEYDLMLTEMPRLLRCRHIGSSDLLAGRWLPSVEALLAQPAPSEQAAVNGSDVAAARVLDLMNE